MAEFSFKAKQGGDSDPSTIADGSNNKTKSRPLIQMLPDRENLGFIPWKRPTDKGYSAGYRRHMGGISERNRYNRAKKDEILISRLILLVGTYQKPLRFRIRSYEVDKLYLAYHEGYGGYKRAATKIKIGLKMLLKRKLNTMQ